LIRPRKGGSGRAAGDDTTDLVRAAREGDRAAFECLYERFAPMVHGILLARVERREVEDLLQEVFTRALAQLGTLREPAAFGSWLAAMTRNRATDHHRRSRDTVALPPGLMASDPPESARAFGLLARLKELPETYRETLTLRFVEGMTGPEIAERTGLTHASVRVNLGRGVQLLREKLGLRVRHE
jgi:RNA polymerase sigma-70 factor (ECF subfamily)